MPKANRINVSPFREGFDAFEAGVEIEVNPYVDLSTVWAAGWRCAAKDQRAVAARKARIAIETARGVRA